MDEEPGSTNFPTFAVYTDKHTSWSFNKAATASTWNDLQWDILQVNITSRYSLHVVILIFKEFPFLI